MLPKIESTNIQDECIPRTPRRIIEIICEYRSIARESLEKLDVEGTVVRTLKGDVISHPAIKIHADATKAEALILKDWANKR